MSTSLGDEVIDKDNFEVELPLGESIEVANESESSGKYTHDDKVIEDNGEILENHDHDNHHQPIHQQDDTIYDKTISNSQTPVPQELPTKDNDHDNSKIVDNDNHDDAVIKKEPRITSEAALGSTLTSDDKDSSKISAYARLDFDNYTFFVQTLQVILGRKSNDELLNGSQHAVDVHLSSKKAISRRHAKIFYNFGTQRFELSVMGRNGAFVDDSFLEKGMTVPLIDGTKIQIGDIPFQFVLPSIELDQLKQSINPTKPINPIDAISLRTNLYNSPTKKSKRKSIIENRRNSLKLPRKLSEARRKSLATATNDEISTILTELGVKSIDDIDDQDPDFVDAQIKAILGEGHESAIIDDEEEETNSSHNHAQARRRRGLSQFNEGEEDEIDQLVKQHNLEQGVELDESILERDDKDIDMDLSVIDEEIVNLAPLIDAHNQDLLKEKEERRRQLEEEKILRQEFRNRDNSSSAGYHQSFASFQRHQLQQQQQAQLNSSYAQRSGGPLMGKPATPRMGKPASIQPPASRLYGRPLPPTQTNIPSNSVIDSRLMSMSPSPSPAANTMPLNNYGTNNYGANNYLRMNQLPNNMNKPYMTHHQPISELLVPISTIESTPLKSSYDIPIRKFFTGVMKSQPDIWKPRIVSNSPIMVPKIPKRKNNLGLNNLMNNKKPGKNVYTMNEIPEHYRTKPSLSFPVMIINVLKYKNDSNGLTINEINEGIKEVYPYYKYCPDGWQSIVTHNVKLNKLFKSNLITTLGFEDDEKWIIDESFVQEKEIVRKKQQEIATQRAKEAAIKAEELKQKQRLEMQQSISQNVIGRDFASQYGLPLNAHLLSQSQINSNNPYNKSGINGLNYGNSQYNNPSFNQYSNNMNSNANSITSSNNNNGQKPKTIAELASEIRRDGIIGSKAPIYFKPQNDSKSNTSPSNIKAQLAANRSQYSQSPASNSNGGSTTNTGSNITSMNEGKSNSPTMNQDTKKSLAYLQKELFTLYKARKLSYNTATTTEIITKALATTIAQVNAIGSKAGVGDNALSFLVERAPQQVSKILDIALSKSIKEKQGILSSSKPASRGTTPGPSNISSPKISNPEIDHGSPMNKIVKEANERVNVSPIKSRVPENINVKESQVVEEIKEEVSDKAEQETKVEMPDAVKGLQIENQKEKENEREREKEKETDGAEQKEKENETDKEREKEKEKEKEKTGGLGKPPSINKELSMLSKPTPITSLVRPPSFKPSSTGLSKPPFISTKPPTRPGYGSKPNNNNSNINEHNKRLNEDNNESNEQNEPNKSIKLD